MDRIVSALIGLGGVVLHRRERLHQRGGHDVEAVVVSVLQAVNELLELPEADRCIAVGVSVPGVVRADDGWCGSRPTSGGWTSRSPSCSGSSSTFHCSPATTPTSGSFAEHLRGAAVGVNDVAYLSGSVGIGGGFLVDGQPLRGSGGYAGEIGHLLVDSQGNACRCGARGCWETHVGENHLLEAAGRLPGGGPEAVTEVISAAAQGDRRAAAALDDVADWTGVGLRAIVNIFNPAVIVLGGVLAQVWVDRSPS